MRKAVFLTLCLTLLLLPSVASADEILTYTGSPYTYFLTYSGYPVSYFITDPGPPPPNPFIGQYATATIDLADPLPVSSTVVVSPVSFSVSVSDGFETITNLSAIGSSFEFVTDATGSIIGWDIQVNPVSSVPYYYEEWNSASNIPIGSGDYVQTGYNEQDANSFVAGTWTETIVPGSSSQSTVPEPSSLLLIAVGLPLIVLIARHHKSHFKREP